MGDKVNNELQSSSAPSLFSLLLYIMVEATERTATIADVSVRRIDIRVIEVEIVRVARIR